MQPPRHLPLTPDEHAGARMLLDEQETAVFPR
jgi:hypothetical protein